MVNYKFKFTLDSRFTETYSTKVDSWGTVDVELYREDIPISIGEMTV